jgi:hypothetical protein
MENLKWANFIVFLCGMQDMLLFRKESTKNTGADRSFPVKAYIHREGAIFNVQIAPSSQIPSAVPS